MKNQKAKMQKVITIVKARGVPDEVKVTRMQEPSKQPRRRSSKPKTMITRQSSRITPSMPRLE